MRVASYNIRKAVGLDWRRDAERILDVLDEIDADIVVLQEADRRYGTRAGVLPLERLEEDHGLVLAEVSVRPRSHGWHGNMILAKRRLSIKSAERLPLPYVDPRGAIRVVFSVSDLEIVGTHLGLTPGTRRKQLALLEQTARQSNRPTVIAGDFNEWNDANFRLASDLTLVTPGPSYHASRPVGALDRFIVNNAIRVVSADVHRSELARRASDHLPIVMDFEIANSQ